MKCQQNLEQLLNEAIKDVVIKSFSGHNISIDKYRECVQARRRAYRPDLSYIFDYRPNIQNDMMKSKLFDFIKKELATYIRDDVHGYPRIQPASYGIRRGGLPTGYSLDRLLDKFLEIAIVRGVETAISAFDKCTRETKGFFQKIILLGGIELYLVSEQPEAFERGRVVQISDGIRLVALPLIPAESPNLPPYLFDDGHMTLLFGSHPIDFLRKTLIVVDCVVTPLFFQPKPIADIQEDIPNPFQFEIQSTEFPNFDVDKFCQALSLSSNAAIQAVFEWNYIDEDEIFSMRGEGEVGHPNLIPPFDYKGAAYVSDAQIEEAKCLYEKLVNLDLDVRTKLQIPIDRWIMSKTKKNGIDQAIDLGIALEALYLSAGERGITLTLSLRAAWHLGKDKEHRKELLTKFRDIYRCRSNAIHNGQLDETVRFGGERIPILEFIEKAQDLCRQSIMKILEEGRFPNWNDLVLGGEMESDIVALGEDPSGLG